MNRKLTESERERSRSATRRSLVGRIIVDATCDRWDTQRYSNSNRGDYAHTWTLRLDNGKTLRFHVEESESGEYGVNIIVTDADRIARRGDE